MPEVRAVELGKGDVADYLRTLNVSALNDSSWGIVPALCVSYVSNKQAVQTYMKLNTNGERGCDLRVADAVQSIQAALSNLQAASRGAIVLPPGLLSMDMCHTDEPIESEQGLLGSCNLHSFAAHFRVSLVTLTMADSRAICLSRCFY